ncbi:conserved hypothetical protein [Heliomicrobium modesticaldum Ice1]|uniref:Uncharacterized protein n=1 Tax=Heliobacterium modesticaldum (strain ATCC 51547 / Ice1) TaxID=498761 RepID=B0TDT1_HELMI|nr:P-loop NTPase [Heliomicrobium modesticaldum]ABZ82794.1 conserved hypothetical protein [Heliomicrobium modesticaldum Ice1]
MTCEVIIAVMSGKGGTGKSTVTAFLAAGLAKAGLAVAVVDGDVAGSAIPTLFGLKAPLRRQGDRRMPAVTRRGIAVWSAGLLPDEGQSLLADSGARRRDTLGEWIGSAAQGEWDVVLIDMPSGLGEVHAAVVDAFAGLSIQSDGEPDGAGPRKPVTGALLVTSLRELDRRVVRRTAAWLKEKGVPIVGVVENGGEIECPHCENLLPLSDGDEAWAEEGGVIACFPWSAKLIEFARKGRLEEYDHPLVFQMALNIWESSHKEG